MGPLHGIKVLELEAIGPGPFCGMVLADLGADVLVVDRPSDPGLGLGRGRKVEVMMRGKRSVTLDLKSKDGVAAALELAGRADALIEGFRPGVMERLGLGPDVLLAKNPKLVFGRMTGWGQDGPLAGRAGHDINYIALVGALHSIGRRGEKPVPPLNLIGDMGGGGMLLAFGIVCGLYEAQRSGSGQVVDAAMVDGAAALMAFFYGFRACGLWNDERGVNLLDGGAHFYDTYETADGKWVSVGSIEPKFYALLVELAGLDKKDFEPQMDPIGWPELGEKLAEVFKTKTRDEWCEIMEGTDVCFAPVLAIDEAARHPHNVARNLFVEIDGVPHQAPAPRFSRTPGEIQRPPAAPGEHTESALRD